MTFTGRDQLNTQDKVSSGGFAIPEDEIKQLPEFIPSDCICFSKSHLWGLLSPTKLFTEDNDEFSFFWSGAFSSIPIQSALEGGR